MNTVVVHYCEVFVLLCISLSFFFKADVPMNVPLMSVYQLRQIKNYLLIREVISVIIVDVTFPAHLFDPMRTSAFR